jgi:hypothetical protein
MIPVAPTTASSAAITNQGARITVLSSSSYCITDTLESPATSGRKNTLETDDSQPRKSSIGWPYRGRLDESRRLRLNSLRHSGNLEIAYLAQNAPPAAYFVPQVVVN